MGPAPTPSVAVVVPPAGRSIDPARYLAKVPAGRLSDALVELMKPYIPWPPRPEELDELETWLQLGAMVWNAVVEGHNSCAGPDFGRWAKRLGEGVGQHQETLRELVEKVAERKRALFPQDRRIVAKVEVVAEGGRATVLAMGLSWVR